MFGGKLKTWMETHIGRQKKKCGRDRGKEKNEKVLLESSESLAHSDTGISSGSIQVLSSTTDGADGYCTTTMESDARGGTHARTVNLSSPESAYSTGYSTDGASLGDATAPHPEYYINIRSGKHYFPSPAPTPTSPNPNPRACITTSFLSAEPRIPPLQTFPSWLADPPPLYPEPLPNYCDIYKPAKKAPPKSPLNSLKLFLKSPKQDKVKPKPEVESIKLTSKSRKWYKQPFKFSSKSSESETKESENKSETITVLSSPEVVPQERNATQKGAEATASPRQRNRIRTNPWIPTEPLTTHNFQRLQLNLAPGALRNRSCTNTPLQQRKTPDGPPRTARLDQMTIQYEASRDYLESLEKAVNNHIGHKLFFDFENRSDEDLTLNDMIGTFNESYVYEKETDILSDSDPTDCEDYVSDSEAIHGGDEDSHDDELDFIDSGSVLDADDVKPNTGRCSFHEFPQKKNSFLFKNRHQKSLDAENRRNSRKEKEAKKRRREELKRRSLRKIEKAEEEGRKVDPSPGPSGGISLRKVLLQRMLDKSCSKSAGNSPIGLRRKPSFDLRETHIGSPKAKKKLDDALLIDAETDKKYNELIHEAEVMLESLKNTPVAQKRIPTDMQPYAKPSPPPKSPFDTRSPIRHSPRLSSKPETPRRSPKHLGLKLSVGGLPKRGEDDKKSSFRAKSSAHSPLDPLGPTFKTFSVFKESSPKKKISSSSSDDSETVLKQAPPVVPALPFGFQFVDLGQPAASHCPQSEPVKRKMYSCSKTYDRLMRTFDAPSSPCGRRAPPPAFYNPMYSPVTRPRPVPLPTSHLGRRLSDGTPL